MVIRFGKHSGTPIRELPTGYLTWLVNQPATPQRSELLDEFNRRNLHSWEISPQVYNSVSLLKTWRDSGHGIFDWIIDRVVAGVDKRVIGTSKVVTSGLVFTVVVGLQRSVVIHAEEIPKKEGCKKAPKNLSSRR